MALAASLPVFFLLSGQRLRSLFALALVAAALVIAFPGLNGVYLALLEGGSVAVAIEQVLPGGASVSARPMPLATAATLERSTEPPSPCGVSTAMKSTFACCTNPRRIRPSVSPAMRSSSLFMHVTWRPMCARQATVTSATHPAPKPQRQDFSGPSPC